MLNFELIEPQEKPEATVIFLHGLGASGHDLMGIVPALRLPKKIRFIFPHAPSQPVTINGGMKMPAWYDIEGFSLESREDLNGLERSRLGIDEIIQKQIADGISPEKIILGGFSQGAALTLFTGLQLPFPLAGLIALSGYLPCAPHVLRRVQAQTKQTRILIANGTQDEVVNCQWGELAKDRLIKHGMKVEWKTYPMGHEICPPEILDITRFVSAALGIESK